MRSRRKKNDKPVINIAVISDTHVESIKKLPAFVLERLKGADAIIHAGDAQYASFLKELASIAPVYSVMGNHDKEWKTFQLKDRVVMKIHDFFIGVSHGHVGEGSHTAERAMSMFHPQEVDMVIYGHDHRTAGISHRGRITLFNPGSPTDKRQYYNSMGWIKIGNEIEARLTRWRPDGKSKPTDFITELN